MRTQFLILFALILFLPGFVIVSCNEYNPEEELKKNATSLTTDKNRRKGAREKASIIQVFSVCDSVQPLGGGCGYERIITASSPNIKTFSSTATDPAVLGSQLKLFIEDPTIQDGDIIFIPSTLPPIEVDTAINITKKITVASDRGNGLCSGTNPSEGALIRSGYTNQDPHKNIIFNVQADSVRITGMMIHGKNQGEVESIWTTGISVNDWPSGLISAFEADNNEIAYCAKGISINDDANITATRLNTCYKVHHSDFYHNKYSGLTGQDNYGYGVMVGSAFVKIYENIMDDNRHDIAGTGATGSGYEAYCNTILEREGGIANFDMHGRESSSEPDAGAFILIHHNNFQDLNCQGNIFIVGRPTTACIIMNNKFATGNIYPGVDNCPNGSYYAIQNRPQSSSLHSAYGNVIAVNNIYEDSYLGWYVREQWDKSETDNFFRIPSSNDLLSSNFNPKIGLDGWIDRHNQTVDYYFGDFNGDSYTDIFRADSVTQKFEYLPLNAGPVNQWQLIANSGVRTLGKLTYDTQADIYKIKPALILSDFDTDNVTDIFKTTGIEWHVSFGNSPGFTSIVTSTTTVDQLLFGRFSYTGNQYVSDVFLNHGIWSISYDFAPWVDANTNSAIWDKTQADLKIGDFDADGYSDIFWRNGAQWNYNSNARATSWSTLLLCPSDIASDKIIIADFNSDNRSDVIALNDGPWKVSIGGSLTLQPLTTNYFPRGYFSPANGSGYGKLN